MRGVRAVTEFEKVQGARLLEAFEGSTRCISARKGQGGLELP
jgi:hypothetical protein